MAMLIEMPFGGLNWVGPRTYVLDGVQLPKVKGQFLGFGVVFPIEKHCESLLHRMLPKESMMALQCHSRSRLQCC